MAVRDITRAGVESALDEFHLRGLATMLERYCGANLDLSEISAFVCIRTLSGFVCIPAFSSLVLEESPTACSPQAAPVPGISPRAAPTPQPWASSSTHPCARAASLQS